MKADEEHARRQLVRFSLVESRQEIERGFRHIDLVEGATSLAYRETLNNMSLREQALAASSLVKVFYGGLHGEPLTEADKVVAKSFRQCLIRRTAYFASKAAPRPAGRSTDILWPLREVMLRRWDTQVFNIGPAEIYCQLPIGELIIETHFDSGSIGSRLCYSHRILDANSNRILDFVSLFAWLGIGSVTCWDSFSNAVDEEIAHNAIMLAEYFLAQIRNGVLSFTERPTTRQGGDEH